MLVLRRKVDENIRIGEDISIRVLSIDGTTVKLGFDAPRNIRILREELTQNSSLELQDASKNPNDDVAPDDVRSG